MSYTPTIGLEIHAELRTKTKMFCNSKNDSDEVRPNVNVCPVCMGFPGTLPVVNREAVKQVLRVGSALDGTLADYTEFDRKNYFYPDLPKGYQISQYQYPLVSGGMLNGVEITRIHLEEDTARSQHPSTTSSQSLDGYGAGAGEYSIVDFNRSGIPLMELVTEPVIHDSKTASAFAEELQLLLRYLNAGEANMEKGQMRVEANVSVMKTEVADGRRPDAEGTQKKLGTKVEVKNLNSFRAVEKAIEFEIKRQTELLEKGESVVQETRGWDENQQITFSQRIKENSDDYRYFPDPDIPKFHLSRLSELTNDSIKKTLPELPGQIRNRYIGLGIKPKDAEFLVRNREYAEINEEERNKASDEKTKQVVTNLLLTNVKALNPSAQKLKNLRNSLSKTAGMYVAGVLSSSATGTIVLELLENGGDPLNLAQTRNLIQQNDPGVVGKIVDEVITENSKVVQDVKNGKAEAMRFLVGQGMKKSKGSANPNELERILKEKLAV